MPPDDLPLTGNRQPRFQRNPRLEELLCELNGLLESADAKATSRFVEPELPVLLVVGAPRSGTTLMMQWLAATKQFAYPSNLLSRFFGAPYVGALVYQLLFDEAYQFGDELKLPSAALGEFRSELGKTAGVLQPNEFWYFWRRFFPNDQGEPLTDEQLKNANVRGFLAGLAALQHAFGKPWAMKGIILQYNLKFLDEALKHAIFIYTKRDMADNAASLLNARRQYYGDAAKWFSVRPPGHERLLEASPHEQVVGQVGLTNQSIEAELALMRPERCVWAPYDEFCCDPRQVYESIRDRCRQQGYELPGDYVGTDCFEQRVRKSDDADYQRIVESVRASSFG